MTEGQIYGWPHVGFSNRKTPKKENLFSQLMKFAVDERNILCSFFFSSLIFRQEEPDDFFKRLWKIEMILRARRRKNSKWETSADKSRR
ncbi:hypothetical protein RUM43_001775, partial [Polyplax serrata]